MEVKRIMIGHIPALIWGKESNKVYIHAHGKMSKKEYAETFASIAETKGYQTISFDLPEHGERKDNHEERCDVWNGQRDLRVIYDYAINNYDEINLCATSLGAYFALETYSGIEFKKCLFQSPVVDMKWLVEHMMMWSNISEEQLKNEKEIDTPIDVIRWDYYSYIESHPVMKWSSPTRILYGSADNLQPIESLKSFAENFKAELTIIEGAEHPFMKDWEREITHKWLEDNI